MAKIYNAYLHKTLYHNDQDEEKRKLKCQCLKIMTHSKTTE